MKRLYKVGLLVITILLLSISCEEEQTKINLENYVVNSLISEDTPFIIQTTKSVSVFDTVSDFWNTVKDMEGKLYEDGKLVGDLVYQEAIYINDDNLPDIPEGYTVKGFVAKPGSQYSFELKHGDFVLTGSDSIPKAVSLEIMDTSSVWNEHYNTKGLQCVLEFDDPIEEDNYYIIAFNYTVSTDEDGDWTSGGGTMKSDAPVIEYSYYDPGMLGVTTRFVLSDKSFDGQTYTLPISFWGGIPWGYNEDGIISTTYLNIYFLSISEKYYRYITSFLTQQENNEDYYAEPYQVYNNIRNGFGIFAGFSVCKQVVEINQSFFPYLNLLRNTMSLNRRLIMVKH